MLSAPGTKETVIAHGINLHYLPGSEISPGQKASDSVYHVLSCIFLPEFFKSKDYIVFLSSTQFNESPFWGV